MADARTDTLSHSLEDYLEAVFRLAGSGDPVRLSDLAQALGVSKPSAHAALARLQTEGLVSHDRYGRVELTPRGRDRAAEIDRRHRELSAFLTGVLGVDPAVAERDACNLEHYVSPQTMERLTRHADRVRACPGCGRPDHPAAPEGTAEPEESRLDRLGPGDTALVTGFDGDSPLRRRLLDLGFIPGAPVEVVRFAPFGDPMEVRVRGCNLSLRVDEAARIRVRPARPGCHRRRRGWRR